MIEADYGYCALCFHADRNDEWILGDAFMRGWYNIHDHANNRFGFVPYRGSPKSPAIRAYTTPRTKLSYNTHDFDDFVIYQHGKGSKIAMIVIFTLAGIGGVAVLVWHLTKKSSGVQP